MTKKTIKTLIIFLAICLLSLAILIACSENVTVPDQPDIVDDPTTPVAPVVPVDPEPTEPTEPVVPDVPNQPTDPTEPTVPVDPLPPDVPIDPIDPDEPTTPRDEPYSPVVPSPTEPPEEEEPVLPQLKKPVVKIDASGIVFRPDENASGYLVKIDDETYTISTVEQLTGILTQLSPDSYSVSVKAVAAEGYQDSEWSDEVDIAANLWLPLVQNVALSSPSDYVISWDVVLGANCYEVEVTKFVDDQWQVQGTFVVLTPSYTLAYLEHGEYRLMIRSLNDNSYILPSPYVEVGYTVDDDGVVTLVI
jgi:hypothetical protein